MKRGFILFYLCVTFCTRVMAQEEIPVDMYTGTPTIRIPIHTLSAHDISWPVALSYSANGIRTGQTMGAYGLGWDLSGVGSISRVLKGLPDDFTGNGPDQRRGWLYTSSGTTVATRVGQFSASSDVSSSTCSDELVDNTTLADWNDMLDTEADIFRFNFGGFSGSFVFDNGAVPAIHLIPFQDIKITYTTVSDIDKRITGFKIRTNDGYQYTFGQVVQALKSTHKDFSISNNTFGLRDFNQYSGPVSYNKQWLLTKVESPSGAYIDFAYQQQSSQPIERQFGFAAKGFTSTLLGDVVISGYGYPHGWIRPYAILESSDRYVLSRIAGSSGQSVDFDISGNLLRKVVVKDSRRGTGNEYVKEYLLNFDGNLLRSIIEQAQCERKAPYTFKYVGESNAYQVAGSKTSLADFWGYPTGRSNSYVFSHPYFVIEGDQIPKLYIYPNEAPKDRYRLYRIPNYSGSEVVLPGVDRSPNEDGMKTHTLNKITFPTGGSVVLQYEANRYYDQLANMDQIAGGLRIKSITQFDAMGAGGAVTKTYDYTDPSSNRSSGKLFSMPQFAVPAWKYKSPNAVNDASKEKTFAQLGNSSTQDQYEFLTLRSEEDLSAGDLTHGSPIGYEFVTVSRPGSGKSVYRFSVPGAFGDAAVGYWAPTTGKFARPSDCPSTALANQGGEWAFPFAPTADIDHERGLIVRISDYDELGRSVRITDNQYQYVFKTGSAPQQIWSLRYERMANSESKIYFLGKYVSMADYSVVLKKEVVSIIDVNNSAKMAQTETEYLYESTVHHFVTSVNTKTHDGTIYSNKFKYPHDFGSIPQNSTNEVLRIRDLQNPEVFRHGIPIETRKTFKKPGGSEKVIEASISLFRDFGTIGKILPYQSLSLPLKEPLTDFEESDIVLDGGTYKLDIDDRYVVTNNIDSYTFYDNPTSLRGRDRKPRSIVWGYNCSVPIASVVDASSDEIAFSDFETTSQNSFAVTGGYESAPRTGRYGIHPFATLRKTIVKNGASEFVLAFWARTLTNLNLNMKIKTADMSTTLQSLTLNVPESSQKFMYFSKVIQTASLPSTFVIEIQGQSLTEPSGSSANLLPSIDDISFMPVNADIVSTTYSFPYGTSSTTDALNGTTYTEYDLLGRPTIVRDKEGNVRSKVSYRNPLVDNAVPMPSFETGLEVKLLDGDSFASEVAYVGEEYTFEATLDLCFSDLEYQWGWGKDYFANISYYSGGSSTYTVQFDESGPYSVGLRVKRPGQDWSVVHRTIQVIHRPIAATLCSNGARTYQCGQVSYRSNNCNGDPVSLDPGTQMTVTLEENLPDLSYAWFRRYFDTETWTELSSTSINSYTVAGLYGNPNNQRGFEIKCVVSSGARKGESNSIRIDVDPCDQ
ncbi:MAG: hypothetical protein QM762_17980 [Chryseolinea sp.]